MIIIWPWAPGPTDVDVDLPDGHMYKLEVPIDKLQDHSVLLHRVWEPLLCNTVFGPVRRPGSTCAISFSQIDSLGGQFYISAVCFGASLCARSQLSIFREIVGFRRRLLRAKIPLSVLFCAVCTLSVLFVYALWRSLAVELLRADGASRVQRALVGASRVSSLRQ